MDTIDPKRAAVLVMDVQNEIVAMLGSDKAGAAIERAASVIAAARAQQIPIFYVVVGFRAGYPEVSPRNASFAAATKSGRFIEPGAKDIAPEVAPQAGDVIVTKRRVSAFTGSDLEVLLRAKGIETVIVFGFATGGVVLSTVRQAADLDYKLVVVKDCCGDGDDEVHRVLTEKVFPRQATVVTASEITGAFGA